MLKALNLLEHSAEEAFAVGAAESRPIEMVLDSGACEHVMDNPEAPGYTVKPSIGSSRGAEFRAANGERIANRGQLLLNLRTGKGKPLMSTFQVCDVAKPLWSVGRICDNGYTVTFSAQGAVIRSEKSGQELVNVPRKNGLYIANLQLHKPDAPDFHRPGR